MDAHKQSNTSTDQSPRPTFPATHALAKAFFFLDETRTGLIALISLSVTTWSYSQTHWSEVARGETNNASRAVAFGNGLFIAAFDNRIFSSTDGKVWTGRGPTPWFGDEWESSVNLVNWKTATPIKETVEGSGFTRTHTAGFLVEPTTMKFFRLRNFIIAQ